MKQYSMLRRFLTALAIGLAALLSACSGPETPQQVTEAFWEAAIHDDTASAVRYSTLDSAEYYDAFSAEWDSYRLTQGRIVIDGERASVASRLSGPGEAGQRRRAFTTYLVLQDGEWLGDYERTAMSINGGVFGDLLKKFDSFSRDFSQQFDASAEEAGSQMEQMLDELESAGKDLGNQAGEALQQYSDEFQQMLEDMDESLQRSLEEHKEQQPKESPQQDDAEQIFI